MWSKGRRHGNFSRYIAAPKRFLARARDFYVRNMIEFDGRISIGGNMVVSGPAPPAVPSRLPKDFCNPSLKKSYNDEKVKEGGRSGRNAICRDYFGGYEGLGRSYSVGLGRIGRIDEDEPCFFRQEEIIMKSEILFPTYTR